MRKHGGTPSRRDKHVTLAAISPPGVARGRLVGGQQSGLAGSKPPPLFTREASSCSSQGRRQGEPWGASPRPSAPTYLLYISRRHHNLRPVAPLLAPRAPSGFERLGSQWSDHQFSQIRARTIPSYRRPRLRCGFRKRRTIGSRLQAQGLQEGSRKGLGFTRHDALQDGGLFRPFSVSTPSHASAPRIHRFTRAVRAKSRRSRLGHAMRSANRVEKSSAHHHRFATFLARSQVCDKQPTTQKKHLASDATLFAWGGLNVQDPRQMVHDFWRFTGHISDKELIAAVNTTQSLAKPNEIVALDVDNATVYSYLTNQGGKVPRLNNLLRPFLIWLPMHRIELRVRLVPSRQMLADPISRWSFDPSEYSLNPLIFRHIQDRFKKFCRPSIDMFASPSNALLPLFCARWPHHQAILTDALECPLETVKVCFAHPPWSLIAQWLHRLRANPHVTSLTLVPWWDSELWWPLLTSLHVKGTPVLRIRPRWGLYLPCVRATGYCRAMAQCALQNYSAQHSARYGSGSWICNPMS